MQADYSDSNLLSQKEHNIASTASTNDFDEFNDKLNLNNSTFLSSSSFESPTNNSIANTTEESKSNNLNNSDITVTNNEIQLNPQNNPESNNTNIYTSQGYSSNNGYGLVNGAEAVAKVIGEDTFDNVPDKGGKDWGADAVNAPEVWEQGYTGEGVVVAVLDSGVDYNHDDLKNNIWTNSGEIANNGKDDDGNGYIDDFYGWNFNGNNNDTMDVGGHGTHVSGTIAGENNGFGVTGIAYDAQIMPVKVLDDFGYGSYSSIADGIYYAVDNGADVINLSLGSYSPSSGMEEAVKYASEQGVTVVMAAGNDGGQMPIYPARYADEYGIAVGAIDENKNMASFSNHAGSEELRYVTAPGVDIYSTYPDSRYETLSGTSMATPHVSGVVALMLSANPSFDSKLIQQTLEDTSSNSTRATPTEPSLIDYFTDLIPSLIPSEDFDSESIMQSFSTDFDFASSITFSSSPEIKKSVNSYLESQFTNYQRIYSSARETIVKEDDFLGLETSVLSY